MLGELIFSRGMVYYAQYSVATKPVLLGAMYASTAITFFGSLQLG
jgi:hypothetical protein